MIEKSEGNIYSVPFSSLQQERKDMTFSLLTEVCDTFCLKTEAKFLIASPKSTTTPIFLNSSL
jgi:hypothetical protein